jgi:hypothetical protein
MDTGRITHIHKEVYYMKRFKLMKGMLACLLSLALVFSVVGPVGAWADENNPDNNESNVASESGSGTSTSGSGTSTSGESGSAEETPQDTVTAVYNPETDKIEFTSTKQTGKVYFANVKKAAGSKIGKGYGSVDLKEGKATLVLNNKDEGLNVAFNKDLFLWYGLTEPDEKSKAVVKPLLTVYGSKEKPVITLNYAAEGNAERSGIASIQKKSGKSMVNVDFADVSYCYAADGTTYGDWTPAENLKGDAITAAIKAVADGNKAAFKFKINAKAAEEESDTETTPAESAPSTPAESAPSTPSESAPSTSAEETSTETTPAKNDKNVRASKDVVVKVKKQANAPKVKVDYAKETIAIKNGFDYAVKSTSGEVAVNEWITILQNKKGAKSTVDTIATVDYVPAKDPKANAEMFTSVKKRKSTDIAELFKAAGNPDTIYIYVRKSATTKGPASAVTTIVVSKPAAATAFGSAVEAEGEKGKKGYTYTLSFPEAFADGYEYVIIKEGEDYTGTKVKWTKVKADKGVVVGKDKSSVNKKTILAADGKFYILIRKSMVKSGDNAGFASEITWTKVGVAETSGSGETATSKLTWEACDAPVAESSGSGESSTSGEPSTSGETTKYTVTIDDAPENTTLSVKNGEDVVASGAEVDAGTTLKITLTANEGFTLTGVKFGEEDWTPNDGAYVKEVTVNEALTITVTATAEGNAG